MKTVKRLSRGRAYPCFCGDEKLRFKKTEHYGTVDGWVYLFGTCGGGVKVRRDNGRFGEVKPVSREEAEQLQATKDELLALSRYERLAAARSEEIEKAEAIWTTGYADFQRGASHWYRWGEYLERIKELLGHGDFGEFVRHKGLDPTNAHKFIQVSRVVRSLPSYSSTFTNLEPSKVLALARIKTPAKRLEFLEEGVPVGQARRPITEVSFRDLNKAVQAINGKDPRGRKATRPPSFPFTPQQALFDALDKVLAGLRRLKREDLEGLTDAQRERAQDRWLPIFELVQEVHEALRMDERLPVHIKGRK